MINNIVLFPPRRSRRLNPSERACLSRWRVALGGRADIDVGHYGAEAGDLSHDVVYVAFAGDELAYQVLIRPNALDLVVLRLRLEEIGRVQEIGTALELVNASHNTRPATIQQDKWSA